MKKKNNDFKYKPKADYDKEEALRLWGDGYSYKELGDKYGYCRATIKKYVHIEAGMDFEHWLKRHLKKRELKGQDKLIWQLRGLYF